MSNDQMELIDPLDLRIQLIFDGTITINYKTYFVRSKKKIDKQSTFFFERVFHREELDSIELATNISNNNNELRKKFSKICECAKNIYKKMKHLYLYGNPYHVFQKKFKELNKNDLENYKTLFHAISNKISEMNIYIDSKPFPSKLPRFLTVENILCLTLKDNKDIYNILGYMSVQRKKPDFFPYLTTVKQISNYNLKKSGANPNVQYSVLQNDDQLLIESKFKKMNLSFDLNSVYLIKTDKPAYCFHILYIASKYFLQTNYPIFGQILYCHKNTNIRRFLDDFQQNFFSRCIIFHPEFLNESNFYILNEELKTRSSLISIKDNKKFLVISSLHLLEEEELIGYFNEEEVGFCRLLSIANLSQPPLSSIHLEPNSIAQNNSKEISVFVDKENQHDAINSIIDIFSQQDQNDDEKFIRFKFAQEMFDDAVEFWDELFGLIFYYYYVSETDIYYCALNKFPVCFEEPISGLINNLNDFPFPIQNDLRKPTQNSTVPQFFEKNNPEPKEQSAKKFINSIIGFNDISSEDTLDIIIQKLYKVLFDIPDFNKNISALILSYIDNYIKTFVKDYLPCLWDNNISIRRSRFLLLLMSSLYVYNLAPPNNFSIMCFTGMLDQQIKNQKINFITSKKKNNLLFYDKFKLNNTKSALFDIIFIDEIEPNATTQKIKDIYSDCLTNFQNERLNDYMKPINYSLSWPKLFKAIIIISRIYLKQTSILSGDTGCGKTSFIKMFQKSVKFINENGDCKIKFGADLNIHGDVSGKDICNHLNNASKDQNIFFFDEFNTSDALPFIENIFINGYSMNQSLLFIGAINPLIKSNNISKILSKIGMKQEFTVDNNSTSLLNLRKTKENLNDYKYFVHKLNQSEDLIIDFNPMILNVNEESEYLPQEEKMIIRQIIESKGFKSILNQIEKLFNSIIWIRQFMKENAVISTRDINSFLEFYNKFNILSGLDRESYNEDSFNLAIISIFALRLPEKFYLPEFKDHNDKNEIIDHVTKLGIKISANNDYLFVRDGFLNQLGDRDELMNLFDRFTYWYLRDTIMTNKQIWKFKSFLYHAVIMKLTIELQTIQVYKSCFVIGPPGTSKSFALEQIGKEKVFISTYMCSRGSSSESLKAQFLDTIYFSFNKSHYKYFVISFEEMGLANINKRRPLKYIHFALDYGVEVNSSNRTFKVCSIGVSNYAMDLANMNRATLIYTDIPNLLELKVNFSNEVVLENVPKNNKFSEFTPFYNQFVNKIKEMENKVNNEWVEKFFSALWPNNTQPETLALRSIYSLYQMTKDAYNENDENKKITTRYFYKVARELVNARRLLKIQGGEFNDDFKDLSLHAFDFILRMFPEYIYKIPDELLGKPDGSPNTKIDKKYTFEIKKNERIIECNFEDERIKIFKIKVDNLYILLDRIIYKDSFKSLCLLTENYAALDNIQSFLIDELPSSLSDLQFIFESKNAQEVISKIQNSNLKNYESISFYFEEDFKKINSTSKTLKSVNDFINEFQAKQSHIPVIIGNNPMLDSLLDVLNANKINPNDNNKTFKALISSDGFSWSYDISTSFYLVLILQLTDLIKKFGSIPLPLLDRLEIIYIDWNLLKYLNYFKIIKNSERFRQKFINSNLSYKQFIDNVDKSVCQYLDTQILPDSMCPTRFTSGNMDEYLHVALDKFYEKFKEYKSSNSNVLSNDDFNDYLLNTNWKNGIRCVIYTKSLIRDQINFDIKSIIDEEAISNEDEFNKTIDSIIGDKIDFVIIKCSKYSEMHDQQLKKLIEKRNLSINVLIVYFYSKDIKIKSTMNWPAFWIEDISKNLLVINSNNSFDLINIYHNLTNSEFKAKNKLILNGLVDSLFNFLFIPSDLSTVSNTFKIFQNVFYEDNCSNLFDKFDDFVDNPNSGYSIQAQISNCLLKQIKKKLLYFMNVLACHFLANKENFKNNGAKSFLPKNVYEFLRHNYQKLNYTMVDFSRAESFSRDFKCILKDSIEEFFMNSPKLYFPNTFGYKFLQVVNENSTFERFIQLFSKKSIRNKYYKRKIINDNEEICRIINQLNRKDFIINYKMSKILYDFINSNEQIRSTERLLKDYNLFIDDLNSYNRLIHEYSSYDDFNFGQRYLNKEVQSDMPNQLIFRPEDNVNNSFESLYYYFDYILNIDLFELNLFDEEQVERKNFWDHYIFQYILSKKTNDKTDLKGLVNSFFEERKTPFFDKKQFLNLDDNNDFKIYRSRFYKETFFSVPQICPSNEPMRKRYKPLFDEFIIKLSELNLRDEDMKGFEMLIRSSCILDSGPQIAQSPEKSLFEKFTIGLPSGRTLNYANEFVERMKSADYSYGSVELPQYSWENIKEEIKKSALVKNLVESNALNGFVAAPDLKKHSIYELINIYMTDNAMFNKIIDNSAEFIKWLTQDLNEGTLYAVQILLLFRSVVSDDENLVKRQLIALLSLSVPWKEIGEDNLAQFSDTRYNYCPFRIIKKVLELSESSTVKELFEFINNFDKFVELKSSIEKSGGYTFVDGKYLYILKDVMPTLTSTILNCVAFTKEEDLKLIRFFIQFCSNRDFLNFSSKIMKIVFELRKLFAQNSRALFVVLNCFSFVRNGDYALLQDLPFISDLFDKLFGLVEKDRNIFKLSDFNNLTNSYEQIDFISKKYFRVHNEFVTQLNIADTVTFPAYDFIPKMSITCFDFNKFIAENALSNFFANPPEHISGQALNAKLVECLNSNFYPFVLFDTNSRFKFIGQPFVENSANVDFLGMCKEDWMLVMSTLINNPDSEFIGLLRKLQNDDVNGPCKMTRIASLLLQIYYKEQCDEIRNKVFPPLDFGDQIIINDGFDVPNIILNMPIFQFLPDDFKNIIQNLFH